MDNPPKLIRHFCVVSRREYWSDGRRTCSYGPVKETSRSLHLWTSIPDTSQKSTVLIVYGPDLVQPVGESQNLHEDHNQSSRN